ncbi:MAG: FAD-dependent oxidoreductase [Elusimicrobia bacterium]|nr:FAD-dependent oxidoreductase [Elusimicrobiota bacterium]
MPPLSPPEKLTKITLPARVGAVAADVDVLVVGGGPAGIGAALGAAAAGARVVIAERYGFFGGNATAALVMPLMSFFTQQHPPMATNNTRLMPDDHGPGEAVLAGVVRTFLDRLTKAGGATVPGPSTGYTVPFDPEAFKMTALDLLDEAQVRFLLHAFASGVVGDKRVEGVIFETKSGPVVIRAACTVDCTGDGDIAALAGAPFEVGREADGLTQPMTLMFRMVDFERAGFANYVRENPKQWRGVHGLWDLIKQAAEAGELDLPREDILFFGTTHPREVSVNSTRVSHALGTSVWVWTKAEWIARRQMRQIAAFLRRYVPGFEESYVAQSGVHVGVRETRRILGEYQLTASDVLSARKFDDVIARCTYPIDIHNPEGRGTILKRVPDGDAYDIPLRSLLPQRAEHVLTAGRCISGTHEAHSSYRVMPVSMATGQAAGVCAALAAQRGVSPKSLTASHIQRELLKQGADLRHINRPPPVPV